MMMSLGTRYHILLDEIFILLPANIAFENPVALVVRLNVRLCSLANATLCRLPVRTAISQCFDVFLHVSVTWGETCKSKVY
jgi:hypothetical protein